MPRINRGTVKQKDDGLWHARVRWTDEETGALRDKKFAPARTKGEAEKLIKAFKDELETHGGVMVDAAKMTFAQLAKHYEETRLIPAKIINGRKIAGVKSLATAKSALKSLVEGFGKRRLRSITHSTIESYKLKRLDTPTIHGKQRQPASVQRELELLRAMLRFAMQEGWLVRSPFGIGKPLISKADETRRERTLTRDEEKRLLAACIGRRAHIRPLLIAALDTACRRGELLKLRWRDVDLASRTITILAENSKTFRPRVIGITPRLTDELSRLWDASPKLDDGLVFGITSTIKTAWKSICEEAGIEGYRWHDSRHTAITRMVQTGQPTAVLMKVSGHTQHATFARYVNPDTEAITSVADALARLNAQAEEASARAVTDARDTIN